MLNAELPRRQESTRAAGTFGQLNSEAVVCQKTLTVGSLRGTEG